MDAVLRLANWAEKWVFLILGALVRAITALLARVFKRGRFRPWRRGT